MGTAIVIGADRGIGAALVELYHGRGDDAVAVCLEDGNAWAERGVRAIGQIDVTNDDAVSKLAAALGDEPIDTLVHVAGVGALDRWGRFDFDRMLEHCARASRLRARTASRPRDLAPRRPPCEVASPASGGHRP